jgi:hypothetical protein
VTLIRQFIIQSNLFTKSLDTTSPSTTKQMLGTVSLVSLHKMYWLHNFVTTAKNSGNNGVAVKRFDL